MSAYLTRTAHRGRKFVILIFLMRKTGPDVKYLPKVTKIESDRFTAHGATQEILLKQLNTSGVGKRLWGERREHVRAGEGRGDWERKKEQDGEGTAA